MEDLRNWIGDALDTQKPDAMQIPELEVYFRSVLGLDLRTEVENLAADYDTLFGKGLLRKNGVVYEYKRIGPNNGVIKRRGPTTVPKPQPLPSLMMPYITTPPYLFNPYNLQQQQSLLRDAKVTEIYRICNELLEASVHDEIPIDLLEEQVQEKLQEAGMILPDGRRDSNFIELVQRASRTHINGNLMNGRLCRITVAPPPLHHSVSDPSSNGMSYDPPPPYRPRSALPQSQQNAPPLPPKDDEFLLYDSSDDEQIPYGDRQPAKMSRFSAPGMNHAVSNLSRDVSNFSLKTPAEIEEENKIRLIEKYRVKNDSHVAGNHEETNIQMSALMECQRRWSHHIRRMPEFLYLMKSWWLTSQHISLHKLNGNFLDKIIDPKGGCTLEWRFFGIFPEDLIQMEVLVLAPRAEQNENGDLLTVNPCIQLLNILFIEDKGLVQAIYKYLSQEADNGQDSIDNLSRRFSRNSNTVCDRVLQYPEVMSVQFDSGVVRLNTPLPFFVLLNEYSLSASFIAK